MQREQSITNKLYIDCHAIDHNFQTIKNSVGKEVICAANIKSNAYGLGLMPIMTSLSKAGCDKFFVSNLDEALEIRKSSLTDQIYVFNGIEEDQLEEFTSQNIIPILNTIEEYTLFNNYCLRKNRRFPSALNIDTGSNMIGIQSDYALKLAKENFFNNKSAIQFIISYFASHPNPDDPYNIKQQVQLMDIKNIFNLPVSLANSTAIMQNNRYFLDMIRIGSLLYGTTKSKDLNLKNALTLTSKIVQIRNVTEDFVNICNSNGLLTSSSRVATIPIGYGDGILPALSNKVNFYIHGHAVPVIGKISMDFTMLDVTNLPNNLLYSGAEVEIIGSHSSIETIAKAAGTFTNNVITSLSPRIHRIYK